MVPMLLIVTHVWQTQPKIIMDTANVIITGVEPTARYMLVLAIQFAMGVSVQRLMNVISALKMLIWMIIISVFVMTFGAWKTAVHITVLVVPFATDV